MPRLRVRSLAAPSLTALLALSFALLAVVPFGTASARPGAVSAAPLDGAAEARTAGAVLPAAGPTPAGGIDLVGVVPTAVEIGWTASTALFFENYTVQEALNATAGPWTTAAVVTAKGTNTAVVENLAPATPYFWRVVSNSLGGSTSSGILNTTTPGLAFLNVTLPNPTTAELNWTNNATYGGSIAFGSYAVYEVAGNSTPSLVATISEVTTLHQSVNSLSPGASYAFFVNTTDCPTGCSTAPTSVTSSNVVTVGTPEPLVASVLAARSVVDVGQSDLFTCTPAGGASPYRFSWNDGNGTFEPGSATRSLQFAVNGSAPVSCRITDHLATSSTAGTTVLVDPAPVLQVTTNRTDLDAGMSVDLGCVLAGGTSPYVYNWQFGDGGSSDIADLSHPYAAPGDLVASCSATDGAGVQLVGSQPFTVRVDPSATIVASATPVAPGTAVQFTASFVNGSGNFSVASWNFGDSTTGTGASPSHAFGSAGAYAVTVRGKDSDGGSASTQLTVHVVALTAAIAPPSDVVAGSSVLFEANASGGAGGPYNYTWSFGDGFSAFGAEPKHAFAAAGTFHPTVIVRDRLGAKATINVSAVAVAAPPAPPAPAPSYTLPILLVLIVLAALVVGGFLLYRRREERAQEQSGRVPPTDPRRILRRSATCRNCGTINNGARGSCSTCGQALGSTLFR